MPYQLKRIRSCLVKVETTEGTDAVPAAADAIRLIEPPTISFGAEYENDQPELDNQLLDEMGPIEPSGKYVELSGKIQARGLGAAYTTTSVPEVHALAQGAGMVAAFASAAWAYDTASTLLKALTFKLWQGTDTGVHVLHAFLGAHLKRLGFTFTMGRPVIIDFTARGLYVAPSDTAIIAPAYPSNTVAPRFAGAGSWALGALSTAVIREASVVIENTLTPQGSGNSPDALAAYSITQRKMTFSARFNAARIADFDAFTKWSNNPAGDVLNIDLPGGAGVANKDRKSVV